MSASYFDAIIGGVAESISLGGGATAPAITEQQCASLIQRAHRLPGRPCGRAISWLVQRGTGFNWPEQVIEAITWYAVNDPDPSVDAPPIAEVWSDTTTHDRRSHEMDLYTAGINSTRGAAGEAIGRLLLDRPELVDTVHNAVHGVSQDPSIAVRSCAILALLGLLNIDAQKAIAWFKDCVSADPILLKAPYVERFVHYAAYKDCSAIWPTIESMLESGDADVVCAASRQVCLLSLDLEMATQELERVEKGTTEMRKAAAEVYAANVSHKIVGAVCRVRLKPFFTDADDLIRTQAASAFEYIATLDTSAQADLLGAFLDARPGPLALVPVVRALEASPVQLPDLVCRLGELCIETHRDEAGDISKSASAVAMDVSKIVVRLYAHTGDAAIQSRCLSMIDEMERHNFVGLSAELQQLDR